MKSSNNILSIMAAVTVLFLASLACGSSNDGTVITPSVPETQETSSNQLEPDQTPEAGEPTQTVDSEQPGFEIFEVGDLIEIDDHTIRLNSVNYQGSILEANFTITNNGISDLNVSSLLSFSAKKDDGTVLEQEIFGCGTSGLDGSVLPGDKLRGDICWNGASPSDGIKIYYEADLFGQGAVVWNAAEGTADDIVNEPASPPPLQLFKVGDLIEVQNQTIRANSIEYQGTLLVVDITIENTGDSDVNVSSLVSFTAKKGDGTKLEQEYFDCGVSSLDGKILAGDRLRGTICWSGASPDDGIKIYYEADFLGEGAIVWEAIAAVAESIEYADAQLKVEVYDVGQVIEANGHTITLNSIDFQGNVLKANFTIENLGTEDINVSSLLLFYARNRDGLELEQELFSCGTSFDGSVLPGDKLRGDICWNGASLADGIKIYYEANLFGEGAIVWLVD